MIWNFEQYADRIAVQTDDGMQITYRELAQRAAKLANAAGGRCLTVNLCTNTFGSLLGYAAFLNHGIVPIMAADQLDPALMQHLLENYRPKYIWLPEAHRQAFPDWECVYTDAGYMLLRTVFTEQYPLCSKLALLLTTSGSTGSPKLVRQSYRNIVSNTESIVEYLHLDADERPITTLPMNYTYGLSIINTHLYVGATIILTGFPILQREFWQLFRQQNATSFGGVPYTYEMLDKLRFFRMDLPSLRTMTQAGGKLSPALHQKFAEYAAQSGREFVVMYGQTEATARMAYLPPEKALEKCGSIGIAIPGGTFRLIDVNGAPLDVSDVTGELVYEGENVALGYAVCGEDLVKDDEWGGINVTGDMAKRDADGYYYITGRKKRFLKLYGSRVNLEETESIVRKEFPALECVCGGVDDKLYAFVTDETMCETLHQFLARKLGFHPSAITVVLIPEIPRNEAGKVLYHKLEPYYE